MAIGVGGFGKSGDDSNKGSSNKSSEKGTVEQKKRSAVLENMARRALIKQLPAKQAGASSQGSTSSSSSGSKSTSIRKLTESHMNQITVLRSMVHPQNAEGQRTTQTHLQIEEIVEVTGLDDEKEVQRILFILEGQKLVAPYPEGDFTSRIWRVTTEGKKALRSIDKAFEAR